MKIDQTKKTDLAAVTSMGIRMTPLNRQPVHTSNLFTMQATSAESNTLNISASLGLKTKILTKFVADDEISCFIKQELRRRGISYEGIEIEKGGPWGYRHQFNITDSGFGPRAAHALNDRAGEVGRMLCAKDFDLERIFKDEGCKILHLSGLVAALSPETTACCLEIAQFAKLNGTIISFDLNYRDSFWKGREETLRRDFRKIASLADILIGNEEDYQLALGIVGPDGSGKNLTQKIDDFKAMIVAAKEQFPQVSMFATTLREVVSASQNNWGAIMFTDGQWFIEMPRLLEVADRVGGGDSFVGGLLYGLLQGWEPIKCFQFGWASGALTITLESDYATPMDEGQIWSIYKGNARIKR